MKIEKKQKNILIALTAAGITLLTAILVIILVVNSSEGVKDRSPVRQVVTLEAGEPFDPAVFLKAEGYTCSVKEGFEVNTSVLGDYPVPLLLSDGSERTVTLKVRDTVAPRYRELPPLLVKKGATLLPTDLLPADCIEDKTEVKVAYISSNADTSKEGLHRTLLRLTDAGGNVTKAEVSYYILSEYNSSYFYEIGGETPLLERILPGAGALLTEGNLTPSVPGTVTVQVKLSGEEYTLRYEAKDTIPPKATLKEVLPVFYVGTELPDPMVFFENIEDHTRVTATYKVNYVLDRAEQKELTVLLTDEGKNTVTVTVTVSVLEDQEGADTIPPVFSGVKNLTVNLGATPDYLAGITVYDGRDGQIPAERVQIDTSAVDLFKVSTGEGYRVVYSVRDAAGNLATAVAYVKVVQNTIPEEELNTYFAQLLSELNISSSQSRFSVLSSVYDFLTEKYGLTPSTANTDLSDHHQEAYWGFRLKRGDYRTACAMLQTLLEQLKIDCIEVNRREAGTVSHRWMLVDYGIGWLYMDTFPTKDYVWTTDGRLLRFGSEEAKHLTKAEIYRREAMTDADLQELTELSNRVVVGWNYYFSEEVRPLTAERTEDGRYVSQRYHVQYVSDNAGYGSIGGISSQYVRHGENSASVTAIPKPGYRFLFWSDGNTEAIRSDVIRMDTVLTAFFEPDSHTVDYFTVYYKAGEGGQIVGSSVQRRRYGESTAAVAAKPLEGYRFIRWSDGSANPVRFDTVTEDAEYRAEFERIPLLCYEAGEGGRIEGAERQTLMPGAQGSPVTAVPLEGYIFEGWSDGVTTPERQDTAEADATYTALFKKDDRFYTIRYTNTEGGTVEGETVQTVQSWQEGTTVRAVAAEGYVFVGWSDGKTEPERSDTVYAEAEYQAIFQKTEEGSDTDPDSDTAPDTEPTDGSAGTV